MNDRKGILEGIRVLEFAHTYAGLYCTMVLADLGAEVIKIEPKEAGFKGVGARLPMVWSVGGVDARFIQSNRNKKSLVLDIKAAATRTVIHDLARKSDVVVDNFRPGVTKRLGIDYATLRELNPRIICCSITGFNPTGQYKNLPSFDCIAQATSGYWSLSGEPGRPPVVSGTVLIDYATAMFAVQGVLLALYDRQVKGIGQKVDVSMLSTALAMTHYDGATYLNFGIVPPLQGSKVRGVPLFGAFQTTDSYVAICAVSEQQWSSMCKAIGAEYLIQDARFSSHEQRMKNMNELNEVVEGVTRRMTTSALVDALNHSDVPVAEIYTLDKAFSDPRVVAEQMVGTVSWQGKNVKNLKNPIRMSTVHEPTYGSPPEAGEHTAYVLSQVLGYSQNDVSRLRDDGVIE